MDYRVDITSVFSTSTLSLKIFRQNFLKLDIPILSRDHENFVRRSYFGGATDFYKAYGKKLYYYDVNSLYPHAMLNNMPLEFIKTHRNIDNIETFFGFIECIVTSPKNMKRPILPIKHNGKTIFPLGTWRSVYFSEEIKACMKYGYKFEFIQGYEYSKCELFHSYIFHFYNIKKTSTGPQRFIAKMHLNQLYGYFGRKLDLIETVNINKKELEHYVDTRMVKTIIEVDNQTLTLLLSNNLHEDLILIFKYQ